MTCTTQCHLGLRKSYNYIIYKVNGTIIVILLQSLCGKMLDM